MKQLVIVSLILTSACSYPLPPRSYTISETTHKCEGKNCRAETVISRDRDCGGWDEKVSYGWELCDLSTKGRR